MPALVSITKERGKRKKRKPNKSKNRSNTDDSDANDDNDDDDLIKEFEHKHTHIRIYALPSCIHLPHVPLNR